MAILSYSYTAAIRGKTTNPSNVERALFEAKNSVKLFYTKPIATSDLH